MHLYIREDLPHLINSINENNAGKCSFEEKLADNIKTDSKSFYAYVRSKQRCKEKVGPLKNDTGKWISDSRARADIINNYFSSVFTVENL